MTQMFQNRRDAGRQLAQALQEYAGRQDVVVLALPRGGVPVAFEVAKALEARLDVFLVRKLGVPGHAELAMGAIASGGIRILNDGIIAALGIPSAAIAVAAVREEEELERRESAYRRAGTEAAAVQGKTVILIDDGLATGASMRAAIAAVRARHPSKVVVAVPTAAPDTAALVEEEVDELVCLLKPASFSAVGMWYVDFEQTTDEEVTALLLQAADFGGYNL